MLRSSAIASILVLGLTGASYANSVVAFGAITDHRGMPIENAQVFIGYWEPMNLCPTPISDVVTADEFGIYSVVAPYSEFEYGTTYHLFSRVDDTQGYSSEAEQLWQIHVYPINPMYFSISFKDPGTNGWPCP
jgi:hypothetical protein